MKTKFLFLSAAVVLFMASCSHGPSEKTKAKVAAFDSAWSSMGKMAMAANDSINKYIAGCDDGCKMVGDSTVQCCEHMKSKMEEAMNACKTDKENFMGMQKMMMDSKPMWDSAMTSFNTFKEQVEKGGVNDEMADKTLEGFQSMMDQGAVQMAAMQNKFNEAKASCMQNYGKCMEASSKKCCGDKKCADMMKKKKA